jgi:predicted RNase H-like HicB family nuclease
MREYLAVIHKDPDHGYAVTFPDFPALITFAAFLDGAPDVAASHLTVRLDEVEREGAAMPEPSSFEEIAADPLYANRVATITLTRGDLFWVVNGVIPADGDTPANDDVRF